MKSWYAELKTKQEERERVYSRISSVLLLENLKLLERDENNTWKIGKEKQLCWNMGCGFYC